MIGIKRSFDLLEVLVSSRDGLSFNQLKRKCHDLPSPTLSRLLKTLLEEELVARDFEGAPYVVGPRFSRLAKCCCGRESLEEALIPQLRQLALSTGETAAYFRPCGETMCLAAKYEPENSLHIMPVGDHNTHIATNGFGQVCMAFYDNAVVDAILANPSIEKPDLDESAFLARLAEIREERLFFERGDANPHRNRVVAPVLSKKSGELHGVVGVNFFGRELTDDERACFFREVKTYADTISDIITNIEEST